MSLVELGLEEGERLLVDGALLLQGLELSLELRELLSVTAYPLTLCALLGDLLTQHVDARLHGVQESCADRGDLALHEAHAGVLAGQLLFREQRTEFASLFLDLIY